MLPRLAIGDGRVTSPVLGRDAPGLTLNSPLIGDLAQPAPMPAVSPIAVADPTAEAREAFLHNTHTGESLKAVYWEKGKYVPDALASLMKVLRDWRNGQEHVMDPRVFDLLHTVTAKLESNQPIQIISGYRSAETNKLMHEKSSQVASNSFHTRGMATDIRVPGVDLRRLHAAALSLKAGGVGFYPVSDFVHVDVGPVRQWAGT